MDKYIEVKAKVRIPEQKINDMIVTAVEGGCRYWASFQFPKEWKKKYQNYFEIPMQGGEIEIFDVETDELLGLLNRATIQTGLQLMANCKDVKGKQFPARHFKNLTTDNEDAETADVFLQLAVMGEIVYA